MEPESKIYVAGHRGLVGSALVRTLEKAGYVNLVLRTHEELDLLDQNAVREFFAKEKPDYVFLAAAKVGGIVANNTYPAEFVYQNLAIQQNVIHESWKAGVKRLLFLGSSCIYPRDCPQPMKEEYFLTGTLEATNRPYAVAKIAGVEMCWAYNRQYGTNFLAVMPTNLYGPGDNYDLENSHVLPALIRKFHLAKLARQGDFQGIQKDEEIYGPIPKEVKEAIGLVIESSANKAHTSEDARVVIWGTGMPRREFLYSDDMADACLFLMNLTDDQYCSLLTSNVPPLINIGCGKDLTIKQLAALVQKVVGFDGDISWNITKPDGTPQKLLDVGKLSRFNWHPHTELLEGIKNAYDDFLNKTSHF
jgi:GDP-L-fucose synthase